MNGMMLIGLVMAAIVVGIGVSVVVRGLQMKRLANEGVVVRGEVTGKQRSGASGATHRSTPYLQYAYFTPDGQRLTMRAAVSQSERKP